jgi:penicillin amidase
MPHVEDPASGAIANANNRPAPPDSPVFLGRDWPDDARFRRIGALLAARPRHAATDFAAMQTDTVSTLGHDLLGREALLRRLPRPEGAAGTARDLLLAWDGDVRADRPEGLVFNAWIERLGDLALAAGGVPAGAWTPRAGFLRLVLSPDGAGAAWCGGDCAALAGRALEEAVTGLAATQGPDPAAWRWGAVHVARFEHPLLRALPGLGWLTGLAAATGGDEWTVSRGGIRGYGPTRFAHVHGAGLRLVADLADPDATLAVIATGQSGNPASRHWGDLLAPWQAGRMLALRKAPETLEGRITLTP